jgi:hypothetical protein
MTDLIAYHNDPALKNFVMTQLAEKGEAGIAINSKLCSFHDFLTVIANALAGSAVNVERIAANRAIGGWFKAHAMAPF